VLAVEAKPPNILFIVSDDLGFNDVSFHGSTQVPTPNIDAIANNGVKLMNYHVQPVCSPTRATFMSGRHVIHTGIYMPFSEATPLRLNLSYTLLPGYLKKCCGYSTHMVGKWHIGQNVMAALPIGRGFDTYLGYWAGAEDYYTHSIKGAYDFNDDVAPSTLRPATEFYGDYSAMVYTDRAVKIIKSFSPTAENPMFLYLPYQNVHWPMEAPQEYIDRFANTTGGSHSRNMVCAMIAVLDSGVGNVTAALKSAGIYDDTFIIFSSDNGGPTNGDEGTNSNNFPLRGGKNTIWEGGTRVVGAISGPGIPKSGATLFEKMHASDWLPTLVTMAAGKSWKNFVSKDEPEYIYGDGVDQWEFLSGQTTESPRKWLLLEAHPESDSDQVHGNAIIVGDMKLVQIGPTMPAGENGNFLPPGQNKADQKYLLSCGIDVPKDGPANQTECKWPHWCLFNVTADPCEYNNIADSNVQLVANLKLELAKFQATAVPPIEPDGCKCVTKNVSGAGPNGTGMGPAWQPCDAPSLVPQDATPYDGLL